jgi:SAM-dependent methyltransferase
MGDSRADFYERLELKPHRDNVTEDIRYKLAVEFIEKNIDPSTRCNLLYIGFESLDFLESMIDKHANIMGYGCDISTDMVKSAAVNQRIEFKRVDFSEYKHAYTSSFFDFTFTGEMIEHLENTDNLIIESNLYLKSGGYLIINTPNLAAWYERVLLLFGMEPFMAEVSYSSRTFGKRFLYRLTDETAMPPVGHLRLFIPAALRELCEYHGLVFVRHDPYYTYDFFFNRWISKLYKNMAQGIFMVLRKP